MDEHILRIEVIRGSKYNIVRPLTICTGCAFKLNSFCVTDKEVFDCTNVIAVLPEKMDEYIANKVALRMR